MSELIKRVKVDASAEQDLVLGLIIDTDFCRTILPLLKRGLLRSRSVDMISRWVAQYFETYKKAPGLEIRGIFETQRKKLPDDVLEPVESVLAHLSDKYEEKEHHNWAYQADLSRDYLRNRNLELLSEQITAYRNAGELNEAERLVREHTATAASAAEWFFPYVDEELQASLLDRSETGPFKMQGAIGEIFGPWQYGWLICFLGPYKRGKTWWLGEVAYEAVTQGLKVAFFSLEMQKEDISTRFLQAATALPEKSGDYLIPVWDCAKNQDDSCDLKARTNWEPIPTSAEGKPTFSSRSAYEPCTFCKRNRDHFHHYRVASWYKQKRKKKDFASSLLTSARRFAQHYHGGNLAVMCFPRFSATVSDLEAQLDYLQEAKGFIPNMVIIDYADILKDETGRDEQWQGLDVIWKRIGQLSMERKVILVTASQVNEAGLDAKHLKQKHAAGLKAKLGHMDLGIGINQIIEEKGAVPSELERMIARLNCLAKRHGRWPDSEVYVLQCFDLGQAAMDSFSASARAALGGTWEDVHDPWEDP